MVQVQILSLFPCFNPYRVFKFVATLWSLYGGVFWRYVSIPIGFSSSLQRPDSNLNVLVLESFQSLSGFQVRCNADRAGHIYQADGSVSIPIGFSSSLQRIWLGCLQSGRQVSIPIGFSSSLQHISCSNCGKYIFTFQSLSGFQVRCNANSWDRSIVVSVVSIPIGFSSSLQQKVVNCFPLARSMVSIPIGFSSSLQLWESLSEYRMIFWGFNPYRVFKFVATYPRNSQSQT